MEKGATAGMGDNPQVGGLRPAACGTAEARPAPLLQRQPPARRYLLRGDGYGIATATCSAGRLSRVSCGIPELEA
jgi:hypothetical protein